MRRIVQMMQGTITQAYYTLKKNGSAVERLKECRALAASTGCLSVIALCTAFFHGPVHSRSLSATKCHLSRKQGPVLPFEMHELIM